MQRGCLPRFEHLCYCYKHLIVPTIRPPKCLTLRTFLRQSLCSAIAFHTIYDSNIFRIYQSFRIVPLVSCVWLFSHLQSFFLLFLLIMALRCPPVSTTTYHRRLRKSSTFSKINPTFWRV